MLRKLCSPLGLFLMVISPSFSQKVKDHSDDATKFDPASFVAIYEDFGKKKHRIQLYTPPRDTRILSADHESTIVLDLSGALSQGAGDVSLNNVYIRAELKTSKGSNPVEVVGYSLIGESEKDKQSQIAFAFQTFDNIAAKLTNLYFTAREILKTTHGSDACYVEIAGISAVDRASCNNPDLEKFGEQLRVFAPEIEELARFFASPENRTINARIATDIFEIDIESLQGIAAQITAEAGNLAAGKFKDDADRKRILRLLLERTQFAISDMSGLIRSTRVLSCLASNSCQKLGLGLPTISIGGKDGVCPAADQVRIKLGAMQEPDEFARTCLAEFKRKEYIQKLQSYLVAGTIDLSKNNASAGDVLTVRIESKGPKQEAPGPKAEFRIRLTNYGWKAGIEPSLFFVKRIGVNEVDSNRPASSSVRSLEPVRFSPFPGMNLATSYHGGRENKFWHYLSPGFGVNATFMTFGAKRDFDPLAGEKGQFTTVKGSSFEIGAGPIITLFGNRVSATYGWNLMASDRRTYFAFGFGFLSLGRDLAGLIKKN